MTLALASRRTALTPPWVRDGLWTRARAVPSLDLRFADNKSLTDAVTGASLITFTRASSGTFVGSNGVLQNAVTNLLLRSEEFDNASWGRTGILAFGSGSVTNATAAPIGTVTADRITEDTANSQHFISQNVASIPASSIITVSCYVKFDSANRNFGLQITDAPSGGSGYGGLYLTQGGTVTTDSPISFTNQSASAQNIGNGWYRVRLTLTTAAVTTITVRLFIVSSANAQIYTGDGTSGIYLWGAQLEQSATVGEYIPTTSAINSAPRFDHNPATGESLGLLVEEARTNSIRNNTMVGAVAGTPGTNPNLWQYVTAQSNGLTVSIVGTGVENGINYIDYRFNGTTVASPNAISFGFDSTTAATGQTWTNSLYWKLAGGTTTGVTAWHIGVIELTAVGGFVTGANYSQTAPSSAALITQRPAATRTFSGGVTVGQSQMTLSLSVSGSTAIDFTIRIGLPQMEQGAFATSPILTSGATATRSADVASIDGSAFTSFYNQSEGTFFVDAAEPPAYVAFQAYLTLQGASNLDEIRMWRTGATTINCNHLLNNVSQGTVNVTSSPSASRFAHSYSVAQGIVGSANGGSNVQTTLTSTIPTTVFRIGARPTASFYGNRTYKRITYWPQSLPSRIQSLTQ